MGVKDKEAIGRAADAPDASAKAENPDAQDMQRILADRIARSDWLNDQLHGTRSQLAQTAADLAGLTATSAEAQRDLSRAHGREEAMLAEIARRHEEVIAVSKTLAATIDRVARAEREAEAQQRLAAMANAQVAQLNKRLREAPAPRAPHSDDQKPAPSVEKLLHPEPQNVAEPQRTARPVNAPAVAAMPLVGLRRLFRRKKTAAARRPRARARPETDREAMNLIAQSELFDPQWYLEKYPDVREAGAAPLEHFFRHGGQEGRKPGPRFDTRWYVQHAPDLQQSGMNPLVHFLVFGEARGISLPSDNEVALHERPDILTVLASPLFDADWYRKHRSGLPKGREHVALDYLTEGWRAGRHPGPAFDGDLYLTRHEDVREAGVNPLLHYLRHGREEGRQIYPVAFAGSDRDRVLSITEAVEPLKDFSAERAPRVPREEWAWKQSADFTPGSSNALLVGERLIGFANTDSGDDVREVLSTFRRLTGTVGGDRAGAAKILSSYSGLSVVDSWYLTENDFRLRLEIPGDKPAALRAYQVSLETGLAQLLLEIPVGSGDLAVVDVRLINPYTPLLLCLDDGDGTVGHAVILPFPSLSRNGRHQGEARLEDGREGTWRIGASLASQFLSTGAAPPSLSNVEVDLTGAIGGEPIFDKATLAWLRSMGLRIGIVDGTATTAALENLGASLKEHPSAKPEQARVGSWMTLRIQADALPTIAALVSHSLPSPPKTGLPVACIIADVVRSRPRWALTPPSDSTHLLDWQPRLGLLPWPLLLPDQKSAGRAQSTPDVIVPPMAIRFREAPLSNADINDFLPFPPETPAPLLRRAPSAKPVRVTVILHSEGSEALEVKNTLDSIRRQDPVGELDLILTFSKGKVPEEALDLGGFATTRWITSSGSSNSALNEAASLAKGSCLLFVEAGVVLHDRRTLGILLSIARGSGIASAGCTVMRAADATAAVDRRLTLHSGGIFPLKADFTAGSRIEFGEPQAAIALPAMSYAVAGNRLRLAMIRKQEWSTLDGLTAQGESLVEAEMDFAIRALRSGKTHVCTSVVTAIATGAASRPIATGLKAASLPIKEWPAVLSRLTTIRALG